MGPERKATLLVFVFMTILTMLAVQILLGFKNHFLKDSETKTSQIQLTCFAFNSLSISVFFLQIKKLKECKRLRKMIEFVMSSYMGTSFAWRGP